MAITLGTIPGELKPRITVVGVGGAGGNAVNNMIRARLEGVEFVVANGHGVIADQIHELDLGIALVGRVHQRPLILVARIQHEQVLPVERGAHLGDLGDQTGAAAKAFARRRRLGVASRIKAVDRLDPAVEIVRVQDVQREFRLCCGGGQGKGAGGHQKAQGHG